MQRLYRPPIPSIVCMQRLYGFVALAVAPELRGLRVGFAARLLRYTHRIMTHLLALVLGFLTASSARAAGLDSSSPITGGSFNQDGFNIVANQIIGWAKQLVSALWDLLVQLVSWGFHQLLARLAG